MKKDVAVRSIPVTGRKGKSHICQRCDIVFACTPLGHRHDGFCGLCANEDLDIKAGRLLKKLFRRSERCHA